MTGSPLSVEPRKRDFPLISGKRAAPSADNESAGVVEGSANLQGVERLGVFVHSLGPAHGERTSEIAADVLEKSDDVAFANADCGRELGQPDAFW